jgi:hypothetical protein
MKKLDLDPSTVETAHAWWAPIHDAVCGPVVVKGRPGGGCVGVNCHHAVTAFC